MAEIYTTLQTKKWNGAASIELLEDSGELQFIILLFFDTSDDHTHVLLLIIIKFVVLLLFLL